MKVQATLALSRPPISKPKILSAISNSCMNSPSSSLVRSMWDRISCVGEAFPSARSILRCLMMETSSWNHTLTSLFSFENKNLLPLAPQKTAAFSPTRWVRKTLDEYLAMRSKTNFSGWPFHPAQRKWRLSPTKGHPVFPGGSRLAAVAAAAADLSFLVKNKWWRERSPAKMQLRETQKTITSILLGLCL
ncbi:hypothetical protein MIMGU_mgv1a014435mg [Erythranthe guttata]|uniref:Uncharacterized protein n=1 Tax=Erythranthe guttata TaxID=4155 RepID=A0A022QC54_ERYGU|nr:hypothetical protein MIMGU_mgv1a014435mg [Erythranthe guttata]